MGLLLLSFPTVSGRRRCFGHLDGKVGQTDRERAPATPTLELDGVATTARK